MAIPNGYVKITPNTLYENVEYYIDTSMTPSSFTSNIENVPYLNYGSTLEGTIVSIAWDIEPFENYIALSNSNNTWKSSIVNGVHPDYPTLNINLATSPDWLYVKSPKKLVPLYEGDEIQDEIVGADVTSNGTYEYTPETGFVATKKVSLKVAVPQLDTSDATATSSDMLSGKTAYVNGVKVTGNIQTYTPSQEVVENGTLAVKGKYVNNDIVVNVQPTLKENYEFVANGEYPVPEGFDGYGTVKVNVPSTGGDWAYSEEANATGTTAVFEFVGESEYTVTLTSDSQSTASSSSVAYTYLSTTQPTSASDYDYELLGNNKLYDNSEATSALAQPVTFNATELWIWGYGYKINGGDLVYTSNTYASATHITLSQNTTIDLVNEYYSSD